MWWVGLAKVALAGQIFVNGAPVDPVDLAGTTLEEADVRFDADGNVHVEAPGYEAPEVTTAGPLPDEASVAPADAPAGAAGPTAAWPVPAPTSLTLTRATGRGLHPSGVPEARWWLVVEDDGSRGHSIEVLINGELVQTVRSGEVPRILDVGAHLAPGSNRVLLRSTSTQAAGGPLYVYLGSGSDRDGTVMLEQPEVQFALGASRSGTYQREYTVTVE